MNLEDSRVLVTGADGFIGSHLVEYLVVHGANVTALVYYNSWGSLGWLNDVPPEVREQCTIVFGDVRDPELMRGIVKDTDIVFHLAALISIPYSYEAAHSFVETNVRGTLNLLNAAAEHGVQRFVHTSTSEVYGTAQYIPIDEHHPLNPQSPYAASKASADLMALSFYKSFNLPVAVVRPFNAFGPRQSVRAVIPTIIAQCMHESDVVRLGTLESSRDFTYVADTVDGMVNVGLGEKAIGEVVNIGSGKDITIKELAHTIMDAMEIQIPLQDNTPERMRPESSEVWRLQCNAEKAHSLGWHPCWSLDNAIKETISWYKTHPYLFTDLDFYL